MYWIALLGFAVTCAFLYFGRALALELGLSDKPGGRKTHTHATPLIGGIVIIPVFVVSLFLSGLAAEYWVLISAALLLLTMGVVDDFFPLNASLKFAIQVLISCFVVVFGGVEVISLGHLFGAEETYTWIFSKPFSVMCLVVLMNAMNMIDGLDGLSGGLAAVILGVLALVSILAGAPGNAAVIALMLAPLAAFLVFNMRYPGHAKASVFMGDAGTLALGLILGWFAIRFAQEPQAVMVPSVVPWIIGLPVVDTFAVYFVRAMEGKNPFQPDRSHIHHRLVDNGVPDGRATMMIVGFTAFSALAAVLLERSGVPEVLILAAWIAFFFIHIGLSFRPHYYASLFRRFS